MTLLGGLLESKRVPLKLTPLFYFIVPFNLRELSYQANSGHKVYCELTITNKNTKIKPMHNTLTHPSKRRFKISIPIETQKLQPP